MEQQSPPKKSQFFSFFDKTARKDEKASFRRQKRQKMGSYSGRRIHQHRTGSA